MNQILFLIVLTLTFSMSAAGQENSSRAANTIENLGLAETFKSKQGKTMPYRLFVPAGYDKKKKYPLVLWLHGGGGRGTDNLKQATDGNGIAFQAFTNSEHQSKFPSFVLAPQCPVNNLWTTLGDSPEPTEQLETALELLDEVLKKYNIDGQRLYVAGQSMGGYGTWALIAKYPQMFAAAVPICGGGDVAKAVNLTKTPIWAFHGETDRSVKVEKSREMVAAIEKAGGNLLYTEYKDVGHVVWGKVFAEPELMPWIFAQKSKK